MLVRLLKIMIAVVGCLISAVQLGDASNLPLLPTFGLLLVLVGAGFGLGRLWRRKKASSR